MSESARLEARLRRTQLALIGLFIFNLALLFLFWQTRSLRVTSLSLLDSQGTERAALRVGKEGPELSMLDASGHGRIFMGVLSDGPLLQLCDSSGKPRVAAGVDKEALGLGLLDESGAVRLELRLRKEVSGLYLRDAKANIRLGLGLNDEGPGLYLRDAAGHVRAELSAISTAVVRLLLNDSTERRRIQLGMDKRQGPVVQILSEQERPIWSAPSKR